MSMKNIYDLDLHESCEVKRTGNHPLGNCLVTRVPGGWIYTYLRLDFGVMSEVFVPFDNGFQPRELAEYDW